MAKSKGLAVKNSSELLSYIINSDPVLSAEIDLPVQGKSIKPIGKLIMSNERYKNAFINALNLIAVTLITRNDWENPWEEFTEQGQIDFGQSVREMIVDLVEAQDYNTYMTSATHFLEQVVPNVYNYIYDINFQKFYKVSVNDSEIAMAFTNESNMYDLIQSIYSRLYESYKYDKYIVDKYQLCRRIVDGTVPSVRIADFTTNTARQNVAIMKGYSNKMTFRKPNYNPAGLRIATPFEEQRLIVNTEFEGQISTEVLATSYFRNDAEFKTKGALIDGFSDHDTTRLSALLGDAYIPFTEDEIALLGNICGVIISDNFFKDFYYSLDTQSESAGATKGTEFYNPETLTNTMWLHVWRIFATSPFANCLVFTTDASNVTAVSVSPSTANVTAGQTLQFTASVTTSGITNKSVTWSVDDTSKADGVEINVDGLLKVPSDVSVESITVTATSVYKPTVSGTASVTVGAGQTSGITSIEVSPSTATVSAGGSLYLSASVIATGSATTGVEWSVDADAETDGVTISDAGLLEIPAVATVESITVTATSTYDETKSDTATITVGS